MTVENYLQQSRAAHVQATQARRAGNLANARALFASALSAREAAVALDPDYASEAWLSDLDSAKEDGGRLRDRRRTDADLVREQDAALRAFYAQMAGR